MRKKDLSNLILQLLLALLLVVLFSSCEREEGITSPSPLRLSVNDISVSESDTAVFTLNLNRSADQAVSLSYATVDGTAEAGSDYTAVDAELSFTVGEQSKQISITLTDDSDYEGNEFFQLQLSNVSNATAANNLARANILDNDDAPPAQSGLDARPANPSCIAPARPQQANSISLQQVMSPLSDATGNPVNFRAPVAMLQAPNDNDHWYVVEQGRDSGAAASNARVWRIDNQNVASVFIEFTESEVNWQPNEAGLLGMAFHPDYGVNNNWRVFLSFTTGNLVSQIVELSSQDNGLTLSKASQQVILELDQPYGNHNGGHIAFGPDGYLYIGFGDGGSGGDPQGHGQNTTTLLGAMLRIDVDGAKAAGKNYAIPANNPFASDTNCSSGCPEIYAWGLRNPWRWSFDSSTAELWLGDVGQGSREEIDRIELGGNYGWNITEGTLCHSPSSGCDRSGLIEPVLDYPRSQGYSVTGGYVYRGNAISGLQGQYLYADFGTGRIWSVRYDALGAVLPTSDSLLLDSPYGISSFAEDNNKELYILDWGGGGIYQLVPATTPPPVSDFPNKLSQTGCANATDATLPADGLIAYDVAVPLWTDAAVKQRWLALPDGEQITVANDGNDWIFPVGTVFYKHFYLTGELVETRLLVRHDDGQWAGYSYEWDADGLDATWVAGGKTKSIQGQQWTYPSSAQCLQCHNSANNFVIGPETLQLNFSINYAATGRNANQADTLEHIGLFANPQAIRRQILLADVNDNSLAIQDRAKAYLHANCGFCHLDGGPGLGPMDFHYLTLAANMQVCDVLPTRGDLGIVDARLVAPSSISRSVVYQRMIRRDAYAMPPLASHIVDSYGTVLLENWIGSIGTCP